MLTRKTVDVTNRWVNAYEQTPLKTLMVYKYALNL